jgi:hypothetical protein
LQLLQSVPQLREVRRRRPFVEARAQFIERGVEALKSVIERADQELEEDSGGGIATVIKSADTLAELLANFVERAGVAVPNRQNAVRGGENVDFVDIACRVGNPGHRTQFVAPDMHSPGLAEPQRPGDVRTFQAEFAEKLGARQIVPGKDIQPEKLAGADLAAHVGGTSSQPHAERVDHHGNHGKSLFKCSFKCSFKSLFKSLFKSSGRPLKFDT